jgi:6-phosphofructokinase 1
MKVGMLTGGGDCPGLNAVLRAAVRKAQAHYGDDLVGFRDGWKGVVENLTTDLNVERAGARCSARHGQTRTRSTAASTT